MLHRTTRSVAMTGAGVRLFDRFKPAMVEMEAAVLDLRELSHTPAGLVRIHMPRAAYVSLLEGRLGEFHRTYPSIHLDMVVDDALIDIVSAGFDLDVRLAGALDASTSAPATSSSIRHVAVASPLYLATHGMPLTPADLSRHRCIQWRRPGTEHPYRWTFQIEGCTTPVDAKGPMTVSHCDLAVAAAVASIGIAFVLEQHAADALASATLKSVLDEFLPPFAGWCVCHPLTSRLSAATHAVIEFLTKGCEMN